MNIKATTNFSDYAESDMIPTSRAIFNTMTANAAVFGTLPLPLATLDTLIDDYDAKLSAKESRSKTDVIAFNEAREELEDALSQLGGHVNIVAKGDPVKVGQSGFPSYNTEHPSREGPPLAPQNLRVKHGVVSGSIVVRYKPDRTPSTNEVQINTVNPDTEAEWHQRGLFQGGKAEISGLTPGTLIWVRVRTVGLKGVMGAWSDPAQIRVL